MGKEEKKSKQVSEAPMGKKEKKLNQVSEAPMGKKKIFLNSRYPRPRWAKGGKKLKAGIRGPDGQIF